ncbi:MAG: alkaline phosphatase family protein [Bacillota bacterium]|nr:alkaline phosphatase family protein [Bacillota bacterium]
MKTQRVNPGNRLLLGLILGFCLGGPVAAAQDTVLPALPPADEGSLYVLYLNWDGFGYDLYERANQPPYPGTPNLNRLLAEGVLFTNASAGVPSLTAPMQTTLLTGAWPAVHGNYYRGYDREANLLRQTGRENAAETLGEVFVRAGLPTASIQQFALLDRGVWWDNPRHLYLEPGGRFAERVARAVDLLQGTPVESLHEWVVMPEPPRLLAIYADDLDVLGHNEHPAFGLPTAPDEAGRLDRTVRHLTGEDPEAYGFGGMDELLGRLLQALRDRGIYERTIIALASDHGMTGFSGRSSLPDLLATVAGLGYRVQFLRPGQSAFPDTQVVVWSAGLQAHLTFREDPGSEGYRRVVESLAGKEYYGGHLDREELARRGAHPQSGDLVVWPKPPNHFKADSARSYPARGQHDTLDPSSHRIFLALAGPGIRKGVIIDTPVYAVDLAPTLAHLLNLPAPAGAQGRVLVEALANYTAEEEADGAPQGSDSR